MRKREDREKLKEVLKAVEERLKSEKEEVLLKNTRKKVWQEVLEKERKRIEEMLKEGASVLAIYKLIASVITEKYGESYRISVSSFYRLLDRLGIATKKKKLEGGEKDGVKHGKKMD